MYLIFLPCEQVSKNIIENKFKIVDARSESRFNGTGKEPREHLKSGRIENSINIPYQETLRNGKYKSENEPLGEALLEE